MSAELRARCWLLWPGCWLLDAGCCLTLLSLPAGLELCGSLGLTAEELAAEWEAFAFNSEPRLTGPPEPAALLKFKQQLIRG